MKATYRSKPFEAFQLAPDMSNWKEALEFMGQTPSDEWEETPEFLDVEGYFGREHALAKDFIAKDPINGFVVIPHQGFYDSYERL